MATETKFPTNRPRHEWSPPQTSAFRVPSKPVVDSKTVKKAVEEALQTPTPVNNPAYVGINFWDFKYDTYLGDIVVSNTSKTPELGKSAKIPNTPTYASDHTPHELEGTEAESEDPTVRTSLSFSKEVLANAPVSSSYCMGEMLEILKDPVVKSMIAELDSLPVHEQDNYIAKAVTRGYTEVSTFHDLRTVHYVKSAVDYIDDFFTTVDQSLDSLGFVTERTNTAVTNASIQKVREEFSGIDQNIAARAAALRKELPAWARELIASLIRDIMTLPSSAISEYLTKIQNIRVLLNSLLVVQSLSLKKLFSAKIGKDLLEDCFTRIIGTSSVERALRRWASNITEWVPTPIKDTIRSTVADALCKQYNDIGKRFDAYAAQQKWSAKLTIDGLDTSELTDRIRLLISVLETVESSVQEAMQVPAVFASSLESSIPASVDISKMRPDVSDILEATPSYTDIIDKSTVSNLVASLINTGVSNV